MKNREFRTLMAVITLTGTLSLGLTAGAVPVYAADTSAQPYKNETVYATIDDDGTIEDVTVSDQLRNVSDSSKVKDKSDLEQIENVKGDEKFTSKDGNLIWDTDDEDICYQGTTKKALPVSVKVTYQLDGKEVTADELTGQSGHLVIRYTYENHTGEKGDTTTPFLMATGLVLDDTMCKNVTVTNGRLLSDGEREMAVGFGIPDLQNMLGTDALEIPDYFEVEADVTDYKPMESMTVATNKLFNDLDADGFDSLSELQGSLNQLQGASEQLVEGSGDLRTGMDTLLSSSGTLTDGIDQLANGSTSLAGGARALNSGAVELAGGLQTASSKISGGMPALASGVNSLNGGIGQVADGMAALNAKMPQVKSGVDDLTTGLQGLSALLKNQPFPKQAPNPGMTNQLSEISTEASNLSSQLYTAAEQAGQTTTVPYSADAGTSNQDEIAALQNLADTTTDEATRAGIYEVIDSLSYDQSLRDSAAGTPVTVDNSEIQGTLTSLAGQADSLSEMATAASADTGNASRSSVDNAIALVDNTLIPGAQALQAAMNGAGTTPGIVPTVNQLNAALNVGNAGAGIPAIRDGIATLNQTVNGKGGMAEQMSGGLDALYAGSLQLADGSSSLSAGADTLASGIGTLKNGSGSLIDGVQQLDDGAARLNDGMIQFDEEGIQRLTEAFGGDAERLLDTVNSMLKASKDYKNFSGITDGMEGEVKFVFVTK